MIFLIFGSLLAPFGSLLAPFGSLLAPFECQTSSKILFLFDLVSPFADVRNHFCKKVNVGTLSARTRIVGTPICGNPSLRPRAELCRRHLDKCWFGLQNVCKRCVIFALACEFLLPRSGAGLLSGQDSIHVR